MSWERSDGVQGELGGIRWGAGWAGRDQMGCRVGWEGSAEARAVGELEGLVSWEGLRGRIRVQDITGGDNGRRSVTLWGRADDRAVHT